MNIPPITNNPTINTTTLQQTIISSLDSETVRQWEQEQRALQNAGFNDPPSYRLADSVLPILASMALSHHKWWPEGITAHLLQPLTKNEDRSILNDLIDQHANSMMRTLRETYPQEKRKGSSFLDAQLLLPPSKMCSEAVIHEWAAVFQGHIETGKFTQEESRQIIGTQRKTFSKKTSYHHRVWRAIFPTNTDNETDPLAAYMTRVVQTLIAEAKFVPKR